MRRSLLFALGALMAIAACHAPAVPVTPRRVTPEASLTPKLATSPTPVPEGPFTAVAGNVRLDAAYLVSAKAGTLVGDTYVALQAGRLITDAGSGLLADQGAGLITDNGSGIIANNGGSLVANNGGNLGADHGAPIVANHGAGFGLLLAEGSPTPLPAPKALLPVAGLAIVPIDLALGRVFGRVCYTDKTGHFEAHLPPDAKGNVAFAALVPGKDAKDPVLGDRRLQFGLITAVLPSGPVVLDEDTALVATYLRACFAGQLETAFESDDFDATIAKIAGARAVTGALKVALLSLATELRQRARASGVDKLALDQRRRVSRRAAAAVLSHVDLGAIKLDSALSPGWKGPSEPALQALVAVFKGLREHAAAALAQDPTAFDHKPYLEAAHYTVHRASDLGDFVLNTYLLSGDSNAIVNTGLVLADVGANLDADGLVQEQRLRAAYYATVGAIAQVLTLDDHARADAFAQLKLPSSP
jgi:hypothetical protein